MRKNRVVEQNRCYHLVRRLAHKAFFFDDEEMDRAVALMRRVEAGVQDSMSYCINRAVSISSDPFDPGATVAQVARECGFKTAAHLSHLFKSQFGTSITEWRSSAN